MTFFEKPKANSGVLCIGQPESLKEWVAWLRLYYADKGMVFRDLRKNVLAEFYFLADEYDFRAILDLYIHTRYYENLQEACGVANDDRYDGQICRAELRRYCDPASPSDYSYPSIKINPMAFFDRYKKTKVGYLSHMELIAKMGCH